MPPILGNNSFETAKEILSPALSTKEESGSLSSALGGDLTDFFKFTLTGSSSISLSLTGLTGNARLKAFSAPNEASEITPAGTSNPQRLSESIILNSAQPGTYYVKVDLDSNDPAVTSADYKLRVGVNTSLKSSSIFWRSPDGVGSIWLMDGKNLADFGSTPQKPSSWRSIVGDFNGDGEQDLFWQNTIDGALEVWLMQGKTVLEVGNPQFNSRVPFLDGNWTPYVGNFDGNGKSDVFWYNQSAGLSGVWLLDGAKITDAGITPAFPAGSAWQPQIADFDGGGIDDILWRNAPAQALSIWIMQGTNLATPTSFSSFDNVPAAWVPTAVDLTGDGGADILWRDTSSGENWVWIMAGKDRQSVDSLPTVSTSSTLQTGDFNGDRIADIFWRDLASGDNSIWTLDGTKGPNQKLVSSGFLSNLPTSWKLEKLTDFNGDSKDDVLWRNSDGTVSVWLLDTTGTKLTEGKALADFSVLSDQVPTVFNVDGILDRNLTNKPQSISGATEATAFDIGSLNTGTTLNPTTPGTYQDSVTAAAPDFFKFDISTISNFTMTQTGSVTLQLLKQGATGTPSTPITYTPGMELGTGTYFIQVSTVANTPTAYSLSLLGTPQIVEILGESFTAPTSIPLAQSSAATPNPSTKVNVSYSIKNGGTVAVSGVKVNFVISRDSVIDKSDPLIGTDIISATIAPGTASASQTSQMTLPDLENTFWTVDKNYYIGVIIDPDNAFTETNETNNFGIAVSKDYAVVDVTKTITADPKAVAFSLNTTTPTPGSTVTATYQIGNASNKAITLGNPVTTRFYLSSDTNFRLSDGDYDLNQFSSAIDKQATLPSASIALALPPKTDPVWRGLTGSQKFFIGMVVNDGNGVLQSDDTNDVLFSEITVNLSV
ncbi:FG-GAP-like repeat-containing protein [Phormidesmis priestleyi]